MAKRQQLADRQKLLNRVNRVVSLIEENAKLATDCSWGISHSQVFGYKKDDQGKIVFFDIAMQPYEQRQCVYGLHPDRAGMGWKDMKHITTCQPKTMLKLCEDIRTILKELPDGN